ncbi:MAG: PIN domain-containing protein [Methanoregula sp.]|nr:PIN domain-containing protein [Methanoregula sp.]
MKNNLCFVDTVCWIALLNRQDRLHEPADQLYKKRMKTGFRFLTTSAVIEETANALSDPLFKSSVIMFFHNIEISTRVEIVFVDPILWSKGWALYEQRLDKAWSLTDCISFEVMREQKIHDALTSDHHFEQAGFRALLGEEE